MTECLKTFSLNVATPIPTPQAYWKLDELAGDRVDSVNGIHLPVIGNPPSSVVGKIGNAMNFFGAVNFNGGVSTFLPTPLLGWGGAGVTMCGWFKPVVSANIDTFICNWSNSGPNPNGLNLRWNPGGFRIITTGSGIINTFNTGVAAALGAWNFYRIWHDPADNLSRLQIDNGTITPNVVPIAYAPASVNGSFDMRASTVAPLDVSMDETGIWQSVLSNAAVTSLYNSGNGVTYPFP